MRRSPTPSQRQKQIELRCISAVGAARGCKLCPESGVEEWPDGWLADTDGIRIPVEVVRAFERSTEEEPRKGSAWMRETSKAERLIANGQCSSYCIHDGKLIVLGEGTVLPVSTQPLRRDLWVAAAVQQKLQKNYEDAALTLLVVHLHSALPLDSFAIPSFSKMVQTVCEETKLWFREVWVVTDYDRPIRLAIG